MTLGDAVAQSQWPGCTVPAVDLEVNQDFELFVRNCWTEPVQILLTLVYATPGGDPADPEQYGTEQQFTVLNDYQDQTMCPIEGILNDPGDFQTIAYVRASAVGLTSGQYLGETSVSRAEDQATVFLDPAVESRIRQQLTHELKLRLTHTPDTSAQCGAFENATIALDNRGRKLVKGLLREKVLCSTDEKAVDNCAPGDNDDAAQFNNASFDFIDAASSPSGPESCAQSLLTNPPGASIYPDCCDPTNTPADANRAVVTVACGEAEITEVEVDGVSYPLKGTPLTLRTVDIEPTWPQVYPITERYDISADEVTLGITGPITDQALCDRFKAPGTVTNVATACVASIEEASFADVDGDGFDFCEPVVGSQTTRAGGTTLEIYRERRNLDFGFLSDPNFPDFSSSAVSEVQIDNAPDPPAVISSSSMTFSGTGLANKLAFTLPAGLHVGPRTLTVVPPGGGAPETVREQLRVQQPAFAAVGGSDHLHPFDVASGDFIDLDPGSFLESVPDFQAAVSGVAFSTESGQVNDEVYVVAGSSFYRMEDVSGVLTVTDVDIDTTNGLGRTLGAGARELALDPTGRFAFVLHDTGSLSAVQVQAGGSLASRFAVAPVAGTVPGQASRLRVTGLAPGAGSSPRFAVWSTSSCIVCGTTSSCPGSIASLAPVIETAPGGSGNGERRGFAAAPASTLWPLNPLLTGLGRAWRSAQGWSQSCEPGSCEFLPDPPPGGGGGGTSYRKTLLNVMMLEAVLDPTGMLTGWTEECEGNLLLSSEAVPETAPLWEHVGLDLNAAGDTIFVVSPETGELVAVDAQGFFEIAPAGWSASRVQVGVNPFAVQVVRVLTIGGVQERAYVANHGDSGIAQSDSLSIVDLSDGTMANTLGLVSGGRHQGSTRVAAVEISENGQLRATWLLVTATEDDRLWRYDVSLDGDNPQPLPSVLVGPEPGAVAVQAPAP